LKVLLRFYCSILFVSAFLIGCHSPKSYIQSLPYVADVQGKGDFEATAILGGDHVEVITYYSPVEHIYVQGQVHAGNLGVKTDLAIGGYYALQDLHIEYLVGFGNALIDSKKKRRENSFPLWWNDAEFERVTARFSTFFFQQSFGIDLDPNWTLGFVGRLNSVRYHRYSYSKLISGQGSQDDYLIEVGNWDPDGWVFDTGLFVKFNTNRFVGSFHVGWSFDDFHGGQYDRSKWELPYYSPLILNAGVGYWIGK